MNRVLVGAYVLMGVTVALTGFMTTAYYGASTTTVGDLMELDAIAAVAVGGTLLSGGKGSYWGTMAGALVLTLLTSLLTTMNMPESVRRMVLGATLLAMISIYGRQRGFRPFAAGKAVGDDADMMAAVGLAVGEVEDVTEDSADRRANRVQDTKRLI